METEKTIRTATDLMVSAAIEIEERKQNVDKFRRNLEYGLLRDNVVRILDLEARIEILSIIAEGEQTVDELLFNVKMAIRNKQFELATQQIHINALNGRIREINRLNIQRDTLLALKQ